MSNTSLVVEVVHGHHVPKNRTFNAGKENERHVLEQVAYAHVGGAFPQEIKLTWENASQVLAVGKYHVMPSSFKAGKYGDLEIDRYNMEFQPVDTNKLKQAS